MKIETFKLNTKPDFLWFKNFDRIPEEEIVEVVLEKLRENKAVKVGDSMEQRPYSYVNYCSYEGTPFSVICDDSYGVMIYTKDRTVMDKIQLYLEQ